MEPVDVILLTEKAILYIMLQEEWKKKGNYNTPSNSYIPHFDQISFTLNVCLAFTKLYNLLQVRDV